MLTNEFLRKHFQGNFALANFAIKIGQEEVMAGHFQNLDDLIRVIEDRVKNITDPELKKELNLKD